MFRVIGRQIGIIQLKLHRIYKINKSNIQNTFHVLRTAHCAVIIQHKPTNYITGSKHVR
jgi:hypothetical protein